ncbi:hypothetical protein RE432_12570 [Pusillimonas sp. SM2304]|uniref:c-type cytochrome n=1 Tax=Pusillimonas sp. SM2304 TaxID=3073241 RepID=UPI0028759864|nr:hypothetical protein [Pusillimonas sp. SM2304]MDS1141267.1 hypothetical protein [Pusillimonas sp. SM2304]
MRTVSSIARATAAASALAAGFALLPAAAAQSTFDITVQAGACANCHGTDGRSPGGIPSIAGRPESILAAQLMAFKSDAPPPNTTIMNRLIKGFSDEEIAALARHFSQITSQAESGK